MAGTERPGASGVDAATGRWVLVASILASSMAFIDSSALNVALPVLQADLGASGAELLWIVNGYLLMLAALILVGGALGDRLGRKRVFMVGIALFLVASLACGLAPTTAFLIAARVGQGLGGALMIPGSLALISAAFGPETRGQAIGTWSAATTMVTLAGPILGGVLADAGWWRLIFLLNLPLGVVALAVLRLKVPESRGSRAGPIDVLGALLATVGLAGLTYGFLAAPDWGFTHPLILGTLLGGTVALGLFLAVEARRAHPMMPLHLFRSRTFLGTNLLTLFLYGALSVSMLFLSLNLVQVQGYDAATAGLAMTPMVLLLSFFSRRAGRLADRYGPRLPLMIGPFLAGVGFLMLAAVGLTAGPAAYWLTFFPGILCFGVGMTITVAPLTTAVMGAVSTEYAGTASGINNAVSRAAGVLAIAVIGAIALASFQSTLAERTGPLALPPEAQRALAQAASDLGATQVPPTVPAAQVPDVQAAIRLAFVGSYRLVLLLCGALAWLSAGMAALLVEAGRPTPEQP